MRKQNEVIRQLREDNIQLATLVKTLEEDYNKKQSAFSDLERQFKQLSKEKSFIKRQLQDQESREISKLRNQSAQSPGKPTSYMPHTPQETRELQEQNQKLTQELQ